MLITGLSACLGNSRNKLLGQENSGSLRSSSLSPFLNHRWGKLVLPMLSPLGRGWQGQSEGGKRGREETQMCQIGNHKLTDWLEMASKFLPNTLKLQFLQAQGESVSIPTPLKLERIDHHVTCKQFFWACHKDFSGAWSLWRGGATTAMPSGIRLVTCHSQDEKQTANGCRPCSSTTPSRPNSGYPHAKNLTLLKWVLSSLRHL